MMQVTVQQQTALAEFIKSSSDKFAAALPPNVTPIQFERAALDAVLTNPDLALVDRKSLFAELMKCCRDGLVPDGKQAYINVFNSRSGYQATYIPMAEGKINNMSKVDGFSHINAKAVYEGDFFEYGIEMGREILNYRPTFDMKQRGQLLLSFATVTLDNGSSVTEIMQRDDVMRAKASSRGSSSQHSPWVKHEAEMWVKSAIHRLAKRLPKNNELTEIASSYEREFDAEFSRGNREKDITPSATNAFLNTHEQQAQTTQSNQQQQWQQPHVVQAQAQPQPQQHNQAAADFFGEEINQQ